MGAQIAEEQAALRRVAVLVARAAPPEKVFAAITEEAGRLLSVGHAVLSRYRPDGSVSVAAAWSSAGAAIPVGTGVSLGGRNVHTLMFQSDQEARLPDSANVSGETARLARALGLTEAVGAPVSAEGRLWGMMIVAPAHKGPRPADTETRLTAFTELAATAIGSAQAREELRGFGEEQAALRRVATLVARGGSPEEVFAAIAAEAGQVLRAEHANIGRFDPGGMLSVVAAWTSAADVLIPAGTRKALGGRNACTLVYETGHPGRIDDYAEYSGEMGEANRAWGVQASVGVPVSVEGRLWGVVLVASLRGPLPADTEARLTAFTELAATAIGNAQAREELRGFAEEQAALGRVATLVAQGSPAQQIFIAVTEEAGQLLQVDCTVLSRYDPDGMVTVIGGWTATDPGRPLDVGLRLKPEGRNIHALVFETGQSARIDNYDAASGGFGNLARGWKFRASVGVPIWVESRLWGVISAVSRSEPLPADAEERLAGFTELAAAALANSDAQAALTASRARIVAAADQTRRRVERDLHDGAQQRLVSLALHLRATWTAVPPGTEWLAEGLEAAIGVATGVQEKLREISHGLHPAVLTEGGLRPALRALARRSAVPVTVDVQLATRLAEPVEMAAYYAISEALANTTRHAGASAAQVAVAADESVLRVLVRDDGCGGADFGSGWGLTGLKDRVEAFGGRISLRSPPGAGTTLEIVLPLNDPAEVVGVSQASGGS
ncbi:MAG TPA: GAF domain-containing protein [Trebonia sp.]